MPFEIVCCLALGDVNARSHLLPIAQHPLVSRLWIVRHQKIAGDDIPKAQYVLVPGRFKIWRFIRMAAICLWLGRKKNVRAFVSFNPIPYGLFSFLGARLWRKAVHFGFIGSDWNIKVKEKWGRFLLPIFRKADLVTIPGQVLRQEMLQYGFKSDQVLVLPHSTDLEQFSVMDPQESRYECIFVGRLAELKRVDIILQAWEQILITHPYARFCVVGDGPLETKLHHQAEQLDIANAVDFTGYTKDVAAYIKTAKMIIIASRCEGFPLVLVEAMCCGLVPISTPVGSIPDIITDGHNGLFFPINDVTALTENIRKLLENPELYQQLRNNVLDLRSSFSHERTTAVWDTWLKSLVI